MRKLNVILLTVMVMLGVVTLAYADFQDDVWSPCVVGNWDSENDCLPGLAYTQCLEANCAWYCGAQQCYTSCYNGGVAYGASQGYCE
jgi:hypothetical protein